MCAQAMVQYSVHAAWVHDPLEHEIASRRAQALQPELPRVLSMSGNALTNGDFAGDLTGWVVTGSVQATAGEAELADISTPEAALLYQSVALSSGVYTISFDYNSGLSSNTAPGNFPDTFFASLYFINGTGAIDIANAVFDDAAGLMDLDWAGPFHVAGAIGSSIKGPEWQHFSHDFNLTYDQVAVAFELAGLNGSAGDSSVRVDNVSIVLVPEPATLLFVIGGIGVMAWRRRRI